MNLYEDFLERLQRAVHKTGNMNRFAETLGVQPNLITRWLRRERVPSLTTIQPVADALGLRFVGRDDTPSPNPPSPTVQARLPQPSPELPSAVPEESGVGDSAVLGVYSVIGGGHPWSMEEETPQFTLSAPRDCFHQADMAIMMDGHSMLPTIPDKALVGVRKDAPFKANELYVAHIPYEGLAVKRVGADPRTEEFIFKSDNPNKDQYPDRRLPVAQAEKWLVGRVVWVMHGC